LLLELRAKRAARVNKRSMQGNAQAKSASVGATNARTQSLWRVICKRSKMAKITSPLSTSFKMSFLQRAGVSTPAASHARRCELRRARTTRWLALCRMRFPTS
jgi:hypothetical protein